MQGQKDPCAGIVLGSVLHAHDDGKCAHSHWAQAPPAPSVTLHNISS